MTAHNLRRVHARVALAFMIADIGAKGVVQCSPMSNVTAEVAYAGLLHVWQVYHSVALLFYSCFLGCVAVSVKPIITDAMRSA
jgi:hypothetical protein